MVDRHAWIGVLLAVLGSETERVDRRFWRISVLGSECLDQRSSRHAWIGDRESGSVLVADRRAWIGVLLAVLGSKTERVDRKFFSASCYLLGSETERVDRSSSRRRAPCLDRKFKIFGIERSFRETLEQNLVSGERERRS